MIRRWWSNRYPLSPSVCQSMSSYRRRTCTSSEDVITCRRSCHS